MAVLVRGAHRPKNSYQGPIDLLVRAEVDVRTVAGQELGVLLARRIQSAYPGLRRTLPRFLASQHLLQMLCDSVPVGAGGPEVYRLFDRALRAAERLDSPRLPLLLLSFDLQMLRVLGLEPRLDSCSCGRPLETGTFLPEQGGLICRECRVATAAGPHLSARARRFLEELGRYHVADLPLPDARTLARAQDVLFGHISYHLERPPLPRRLDARFSRRTIGEPLAP